jgi:hypothetical protein
MNETQTPNTMERYAHLSQKLSNKTITEAEKKELFILAFGEDYVNSKDKGARKTYAQ